MPKHVVPKHVVPKHVVPKHVVPKHVVPKHVVPKHVVIVGGGPAGLEAARVAADRGHRVTLLERSERLGGSTWFATLSGSANQLLVDWLLHETARPEIDIRCSTEATAGSISELAPDVVIVATGTTLLHVYGDPAADAAELVRVLASPDCSDRHVSVIGGGMIGLSLADFLQTNGHHVTVLEPGAHFGLGMAMPRRWAAVAAARSHGVTFVRNTHVTEVEIDAYGHHLRYAAEALADPEIEVETELRADHVIVATVSAASISAAEGRAEGLAAPLRARGIDVRVVGDAGGVGYLQGAIHSANAVAATI